MPNGFRLPKAELTHVEATRNYHLSLEAVDVPSVPIDQTTTDEST